MAVNQMHFYSEALGMYTTVNVILPLPRRMPQSQRPMRVLTLLHGMGDDYSAWLHRTNIENYALRAGLAVVMPDGNLSCWENMEHGGRYRDYILDELPRVMHACLPLSSAREDNFIAGCSMGGFGALKLGLAAPEKWSAIGCFSAGHREYRPDSPRNQAMLRNVYGSRLDEFEQQIERDALRADKPPLQIWHGCGDEDILRENAERTRAFLQDAPGIAYHFEILPGKHNWLLWDGMVERFIRSLNLPAPEVHLL